jgi:hypothetical protein
LGRIAQPGPDGRIEASTDPQSVAKMQRTVPRHSLALQGQWQNSGQVKRMSKLININDALKKLCEFCSCGDYEECDYWCSEFENISNIPTVDAE